MSFSEHILANSTAIRLALFAGVFAAFALWETRKPRRERGYSRWLRWPSNLGIVALNTVVVRILLPGSAMGVALLGEERSWGLFNNVAVPAGVTLLLSVVLLDLAIYLQHIMFHAVPVLWRLHRVHHADLDFDVTTGSRFHPIEMLLSMGIKVGTVAALGTPALAVLMFEVLLSATALFNHANLQLPPAADRVLRWFLVTPDMHRVHHSAMPREANSNFGFNLPWWDRLFGTYRAQPEEGHRAMTLGIRQFRSSRDLRLDRMLLQPFVRRLDDYPIAQPGEKTRRRAAPSSASV